MTSTAIRWRSRAFLVAISILTTLLFVEGGTWALFKWPQAWLGRIPSGTERSLIGFYNEFFRGPHLQFRPDCYEPDTELLYRPKPGRCRFATSEFDTEVRTSARYLREDRSVDDPDLVFLGDSYTLGWGVEREEAYPNLVANTLGIKEAVVAASSFGTVRELLLLRRLGLRDLKGVVLQYSMNDVNENVAFVSAGRHVPSLNYEESLEITRRIYEKRVFKRARHWVSLARAKLFPQGPFFPPPTSLEGHARALLSVLGAFAEELKGRPVIIFAEGFGEDEQTLVKAINDTPKPPGLGPVIAIEVMGKLSRSDLFQMDVHWRASGHRRVAETLAREIAAFMPGVAASPRAEGPAPSRSDRR